MILWFVIGFMGMRPPQGQPWNRWVAGGNLLIFVLLALLGWKTFGAALHN